MVCFACPRRCGVDRAKTVGACGENEEIRVGFVGKHLCEEPCISGKNGSGAFFFSGCNLKCVFCQNYEISGRHKGRRVTEDELIEQAKALKDEGVHNFSLVTATHFLPYIKGFINRLSALNLPIVYNSSGYESVDTLKEFCDHLSVYLPDFKYYSDEIAQKYSSAPNYRQVASKAIEFMCKCTGAPRFDGNGMIQSGVIIRHLVLPGQKNDSIAVMDLIADRFPNALVSIMRQYTPEFNRGGKELNRKITSYEYDCVVDHAVKRGIKGFMQEAGCESSSFTPKFFE
ncbi:MAG: radical SAM protein [Clostridia bacterium]|nr:radical SAM protein [Clostridia bacterium]